MTWEEVYSKIKNKKNDIDDETLKYFTNYFYVLSNRREISSNLNIDELIDNALRYANKIKFYDENDDIYKYLGKDCKGIRYSQTKTIYVRSNLEEPLREMIIYHELHHAVQSNPENENVGINQKTNFGRLIMEAQTQYFAEEVYKEIYKTEFKETSKPTESLRMLSGGIICSSLHNYEMYDSLTSKLCILLGVSKDFLVYINFFYKGNAGMDLLKSCYENAKKKYNFPYEFEDFMFRLDYIYCTDLLSYQDNSDKVNILNGLETNSQYIIHENKAAKISLKKQFNLIDDIDTKYFLCLFDSNGNYTSFANYMCKNESRSLAQRIVMESSQHNNMGSGVVK